MARSINVEFLIAGCRKGNRASQIKLYEHFYSYGMGVALPYANSREEALEILNDGFLKVFLKIDQYKKDFPFKPWLRKILIHAAIDYHRKHHKVNKNQEEWQLPRSEDYDQNLGLENLKYEDVIRLIHHLPPAYRLVFNMNVIEGMSHREISQHLGITIGTSKSNLARARMKLQELIHQANGFNLKTENNG